MSELYHFGIKGQKWGIRRYQNSDGSLTEEGRARYGKANGKKKFAKDLFNDLNRTPLFGKNYNSEINKKIAAWGKTAEEAKMMSAKDPLSYFDLSRSRDQTRILSDVYDHMPSVMKKRKEQAKERARKYMSDKDIHSIKLSNIKDKTKKQNRNRTNLMNLINQMNRMDEINRTNWQAMENHNQMVNQHMQIVQLHNQLAGF